MMDYPGQSGVPESVSGNESTKEGGSSMQLSIVRGVFVGVALVIGAAQVAYAETITFKADANGQSQVPANDTKGTGKADVTYDTASKNLTWTVTFSGLTGDATAAHFHGPAEPGKNAPVVIM